MTGMCLKKGNSKFHREGFSLLTRAIFYHKEWRKFFSFNIQISFCTRGSVSTSLVRTAFSPELKDSTESKKKVTGHCHLHCEAEVSGKTSPAPWIEEAHWRATYCTVPSSPIDFHSKDPMVLSNKIIPVLQNIQVSLSLLSVVTPPTEQSIFENIIA